MNYVSTCNTCAWDNPARHWKHEELTPLPVPAGPWKGISCDFITDVSESDSYDTILVFVDQFMNMAHFPPCKKTTTTSDFIKMFMNYIVRLHGLSDSVVSDCGSIFTSKFWRALSRHLGVKEKLSTAFHPQTDGQTEQMNQTLEQY